MKEAYIDRGISQSRFGIFEEGKITDIYIENHDDASISGNIYKGRVENVVAGLNAVFVNIGIGKNGILHFDGSNNPNIYKRGQEILVQVIREPIGDKGPRVSEEITIPGKYIVLLPGVKRVYISQKISDADAVERLNSAASELMLDDCGLIFRTETLNAGIEAVKDEFNYLKNLWDIIKTRQAFIKPPELVYNTRDFLNYILREYLKADIDKIYVNRKNDLDYITEALKQNDCRIKEKVEWQEYNFKTSSLLSSEIAKIMDRKVTLPSGGYLIVDRTEALTAIDVNTGSYTGDRDKEDTILKTNLEACREAFRTIKLKNLSGIILIDFINMSRDKNKNDILSAIKDEFKSDKSSSRIHGFTSLGLLEISRAKRGKHIYELIYDVEGHRYNASYLLKEIENKCLRLSKHYSKNNFDIYINNVLTKELQCNLYNFTSEMKKIYDINVTLHKSGFVRDYLFDKEFSENYLTLESDDIKITAKLLSYSEENQGEAILRIKSTNS